METETNAVWRAYAKGRLADMMARLRHGLGITAVGVVLGVIVAYAAIVSFGVVDFLLSLWRPNGQPGRVGWQGVNITLILIPALAGLAIGGLLVWLRPQKPVELADVIHAAHRPDPQVSRTAGYVSLLKSVLALGAGSTTGLYGPLVVLGASLAATIKRLLTLTPQYGEMAMGAGVAAAISAAFSAPLAGILFAHEVVLRHYSLRFFAPVTIASATAYVLAGEVMSLHISLLPSLETRMAGPVDILLLLVLGVLAGLLAVVVMRFITRLREAVANSRLPIGRGLPWPVWLLGCWRILRHRFWAQGSTPLPPCCKARCRPAICWCCWC